MASLWAKVLEHAGELEKVTREPLEGDTQILLDIQKKVGEIGKQLGGGQASSPHLGGQPTWSNVLKGSHLPARVEVRMEEMSGTEKEILAKYLEKIRKAIPDTKAIIPHPRAQNKVLVIVRDEKRRDQITQCGIQGVEGVKLIRRPFLIMASGISLNTEIRNAKCEENEKWLSEVRKRNGMGIERVEWLYSTKELNRRRQNP